MSGSREARAERIRRSKEGCFDLLVAGGGIVGAGVARDAQMRGLRTLLVERADFASGTSSRSSRLLHGGLRYLAQGSIGLVHEASREKMLLARLAPHLCQPLPFLFPVWRGSPWPRWKLVAGVHLYDLLCGRANFGKSSVIGASRLADQVPELRRDGLLGGVRYFDALTNDARLVIDTLRSAESVGALLLNYTTLVACERGARGWRARLRDEVTGEVTEVDARTVVNATGPWANRLPHSRVRLRLTKGAHLVIDRARLPVSEAVVLPEGDRILFVIPWGERVILGTTDTDYDGDPADVRTDAADVDYILGVVNNAFPRLHLAAAEVISSWAGVRPLIAPRRSAAGAPSDISRGHQITVAEPGWIDVAGGKLTTYRLMAEQTVDRVGRCLGTRLPRSRTAQVPIGPHPDEVNVSGVLPPPVSHDVVRQCCRTEWVVHLDDLLLRRTSWHYYHPATSVRQTACEWMAEDFGWDSGRKDSEWRRYLRHAEFVPGRTEAGA